MSGLGDRWDELPEALQPGDDEPDSRATRQDRRERRGVLLWRAAIAALWLLIFAAGVRAGVLLSGGD